MRVLSSSLLLLCVLGYVLCDVYMHNPRGSNNRLNERTAVRRNANRLFDSQNNNRGGYNTGDAESTAANNDPNKQYSMQYYQSGPEAAAESRLIVEWTNQHGCGGSEDSSPHKLNCDIVIQYMCQNDVDQSALRANLAENKDNLLRDGLNTQNNGYQQPNRQEINENNPNRNAVYTNRMSGNLNQIGMGRGYHESMVWYDMCRYREANGGLFTADQRLNNGNLGYKDSSRTRQNPNGNRSGFECPEERDYYPYWFPTLMSQTYDQARQTTPWIDMAYLTSNTSRCDLIKKGSFNQNGIPRCVVNEGDRTYGRAITEAACTAEGGTWVTFQSYLEILTSITTEAACNAKAATDKRNKISWISLRSDETAKKCVVQAPEVDCTSAPWTRVNHNGNSPDSQGNASRYDAVLPYFPSDTKKRCVMRLRYNISTDDYDPFNTNSASNEDIQEGVVSPIEQNPLVDVGASARPLRLALNTNQYGRTFQDRSHVFRMLPRDSADMTGKIIHNLNVRGKRGNIVQTYPAVEYDFIPNRATVSTSDLVHIQWTGSNTHNNQPNGGDGQTGDAGEGQGGTDRSNFLEMQGEIENYPAPFENTTFWANVKSVTQPSATAKDIAAGFFSSGYYCGAAQSANVCNQNGDQVLGTGGAMNDLLNNAPASYFGHVLKFTGKTTVAYMCSRNNNFSNRSQKGILWVVDPADAAKSQAAKKSRRRSFVMKNL
ncbi:hypothetical protein ACHWQZ_G016634 [Mnemiopsis leidyi]